MATLDVRSRAAKCSLAASFPLNQALCPNISEPTRTLLRVDKLGVTGSSPVPPTELGSAENRVCDEAVGRQVFRAGCWRGGPWCAGAPSWLRVAGADDAGGRAFWPPL